MIPRKIDDEQGASGAIEYNYGYLLSDKMFEYFFLYAGDDINLSTELVLNPYARRILAGGVFQNRLNSPSGSSSNNISGTLSIGSDDVNGSVIQNAAHCLCPGFDKDHDCFGQYTERCRAQRF